MDLLNSYGFGADIDSFESYIENLREAAGMGKPMVDDAVYDQYVRLLRELKPESKIFTENWEVEETPLESYDELLNKYGMCSITTFTTEDELRKFIPIIEKAGGKVDLCASLKENGHSYRAVYKFGELVSATTRGRYKKGRDITYHVSRRLPNKIQEWTKIPLVEIRGETLVKIDTFEKYLKERLKTPLSSVTSLIKESATDTEIDMLTLVAYKILSNSPDLQFETLFDELEYLKSIGFEVPQYIMAKGVTVDNFLNTAYRILAHFESLMDNGEIEYSCDGVVVAINDNETFYGMGKDGNAWLSNFAMKMGKYWESNIYSSTIVAIEWVHGKTYITPKAIVEPVICANGATVTTVPLYNVGVMDRYGYIPGEKVYFRFGGEQSVLTCDYLGNSVKV